MRLLEENDGPLAPESKAMRLFRRFGRDDIAWSLRRLHVPVPKDALVLEVGSGGNPFPRSNVLLDAYESTGERHFQALVDDRPTVLGRIENLPFRDDAFDFVIACHVIEHSSDIEACLKELQRVGRAGYIETPDAFFERINPYHDHRVEVTMRDGALSVRRKRDWREDPEIVELYEAKVKRSPAWMKHLRSNAFAFHVRYFWSRQSGGLRFRIASGVAGPGPGVPVRGEEAGPPPPAASLRQSAIAGVRGLLSQRRRNRALDLLPLLRCPACKDASLRREAERLRCNGCGASAPSPRPQLANFMAGR